MVILGHRCAGGRAGTITRPHAKTDPVNPRLFPNRGRVRSRSESGRQRHCREDRNDSDVLKEQQNTDMESDQKPTSLNSATDPSDNEIPTSNPSNEAPSSNLNEGTQSLWGTPTGPQERLPVGRPKYRRIVGAHHEGLPLLIVRPRQWIPSF